MGSVQLNKIQRELGGDITTERLAHALRVARRPKYRSPTQIIMHTFEGEPAVYVQKLIQRIQHVKNIMADWRKKRKINGKLRQRSGTEFLISGKYVAQQSDPSRWRHHHCHCEACSIRSIGLEMDQDYRSGVISWETFKTAARLVVELCKAYGIQLLCQWPHKGPLLRFRKQKPTIYGVGCHFNCTRKRDENDCGKEFFEFLIEEWGFTPCDFEKFKDLKIFKPIQVELKKKGFYTGGIDGIPGRGTTEALFLDGHEAGLYNLPLMAELPDPTLVEWPWVAP